MWTAGQITYDMLDHPWFKLPLKVGMIRTRVSPASWGGSNNNSWMEPMFCPELTPKCLPSLYEGRVEEGGHCCSKIFTATTDSIFSQLNGRGSMRGGMTCDTCWSPAVPVTPDHRHQNPIRHQPTSQSLSGHSIQSISPLFQSVILGIFSGGVLW